MLKFREKIAPAKFHGAGKKSSTQRSFWNCTERGFIAPEARERLDSRVANLRIKAASTCWARAETYTLSCRLDPHLSNNRLTNERRNFIIKDRESARDSAELPCAWGRYVIAAHVRPRNDCRRLISAVYNSRGPTPPGTSRRDSSPFECGGRKSAQQSAAVKCDRKSERWFTAFAPMHTNDILNICAESYPYL